MNKPKLFCDFDDCIVQSSRNYCQTYNHLLSEHPDFTPSDYTLNEDWNFKDVAPLMKDRTEFIFGHPLFFKYLKLFPHAEEVLKVLNDKFDIYIVTIGTLKNLELKSKYINNKLPFIKNVILLSNDGCKMDKSIVSMQGSSDMPNYFIDDNECNLFSQGTTPNLIKYCYGVRKPWNAKWLDMNGRHVVDWLDIMKKLLLKKVEY